jgi:hypothetical protein
MTMTHNFLIGANTRPSTAEATVAEIVINLADGTLWSKNNAEEVIQVGGKDVDLSAYALTVDVNADNAAQDLAIAANLAPADVIAGTAMEVVDNLDGTITLNVTIPPSESATWGSITGTLSAQTDLQAALDLKETIVKSEADDAATLVSANAYADAGLLLKEDAVTFGNTTEMAIVNATGDGFDFIPQPDQEFYKMRGSVVPYTGATVNGFADTTGDNVVTELVGAIAPVTGGDPSGVTYRTSVDLGLVVIHPGDAAIDVTVGDLIFWSGDSAKWLHLPASSAGGVQSLNGQQGVLDILPGDGVLINSSTGEITVSVDTTVSRSGHTHAIADVTGLQIELDGKASASHTHLEADITDLDKYTKAEVDGFVVGGQYVGTPV